MRAEYFNMENSLAKTKTDLEGELWRQMTLKRIAHHFEQQIKLIPGRRYAWDFVSFKYNLAVEVQGSIWVKGGHNTGTGLNRDYEKLNMATLAGYSTLMFSGDMVKDGRAIQTLEEFLASKYKQQSNGSAES